MSVIDNSPMLLGDATLFTVTIRAGTNAAYDWSFGDGSRFFTITQTPERVRVVYHLYQAAGVYTTVVAASNS